MNKLQPASIAKEEVAALEVIRFEKQIIVIDSLADAEKAVRYLSNSPLIGFDTETRPSFKKGKHNDVSLLQLSTLDICFLFRLNRIGLPESLLLLLQSESSQKIGLSLKDDFGALRRISAFEPHGFIDLQAYVKRFGIEDQSLQKIYALLFQRKISKSQRLSNWEAEKLTEAQQRYAATDAWACIEIYLYLKELESLKR